MSRTAQVQRNETIMRNQDSEMPGARKVMRAVCEVIEESGSAPFGVIYSGVAGQMTLPEFSRCIDLLAGSGVIKREGNILRWTGSVLAA